MNNKSVGLLVAAMLSGCAYSPTEQAYREHIQTPDIFEFYTDADSQVEVEQDWWTVFGSTPLNELMTRLMADNLSLEEARMRVDRAVLLLEQSRADNIPDVSAGVSGRSGKDFDGGSTSSSSSGNVGLSYTFDVWGSREATQLGLSLGIDSQRFTQRSAALQVQGLLASEYFNLLSLQQRLVIARKNYDAADQLYELVRIRFEEGDASGIEVSQQQNTLLTARGELLRLNNQATLSRRAIAALLGDAVLTPVNSEESILAMAVPEISLYQPASVLKQRPDVQIADVTLQQADIAVYQAGIQGLPGLSFSADLSVSDLLDLASGWSVGAALSSAATLFDGGRIGAGKKIAATDRELAWNNFRATTINASQSLLDALDNFTYQKAAYELDLISLENNERLYKLAEIRYKAGDTDFLNLLSAQRSWFSAQLTVITSYQQSLAAASTVYLEAGGRPQLINRP